MFAVIACAMGLSGCSSEDDCATNPEPAGDVTEIKLSAGIQGVATRSPVSTNDNITAPFVASATTGDYTTNAWSSTVTFVASSTPTAALSFSPARYYPVDNSPIYIRGYYPAGTLSGKTVTLAGDGTEDVMLTAQASGTKATAGALSFVFNHLLTQLQFKLVAGAGYPASGVNVTSLVIKQQKDTCHTGPEYIQPDVYHQRPYPFGYIPHPNGRKYNQQLSDGEKRRSPHGGSHHK